MPHLPFIVGSYAAAVVVLAWCALSPVLKARRLIRLLQIQTKDSP